MGAIVGNTSFVRTLCTIITPKWQETRGCTRATNQPSGYKYL